MGSISILLISFLRPWWNRSRRKSMGWTMSNDAGQIIFSLLRCHSNRGCQAKYTNNATPCKCHSIQSVNSAQVWTMKPSIPVWSYQHYPPHQAPLQLRYLTTQVWAQLLLHQNAEVPRPTSGYNITPLKRRQPDGVKCGFIGFSPRLNRALLMEATAYLCNFYHRSKPNIGFIVAFIQSAILLLSKADFVNGGHILSLCRWSIEIFVSNLKGTNKKRPVLVTKWPSVFFCYWWRSQFVYDHTIPSLKCQYLHL